MASSSDYATFVPFSQQSSTDLAYMDEAIRMGEEALDASEIPVGCILVYAPSAPSSSSSFPPAALDLSGSPIQPGTIVSRGRNYTNELRNATAHAEFIALSQLLPPTSNLLPSLPSRQYAFTPPLRDLTLYVTVEPCFMCASALRQVGVGRVVYGAGNDRFGGCGGVKGVHSNESLKASPPYVAVGGYRRTEAIMLLRRFYITENTNAPKPKKKSNRVLKLEVDEMQPSPVAV